MVLSRRFFGRLRAVSLFCWSVEQNARDAQMTTRVTEGARRETGSRPCFSRLAASSLNARARGTPLTKSDEENRDRSQSTFSALVPLVEKIGNLCAALCRKMANRTAMCHATVPCLVQKALVMEAPSRTNTERVTSNGSPRQCRIMKTSFSLKVK